MTEQEDRQSFRRLQLLTDEEIDVRQRLRPARDALRLLLCARPTESTLIESERLNPLLCNPTEDMIVAIDMLDEAGVRETGDQSRARSPVNEDDLGLGGAFSSPATSVETLLLRPDDPG